jgi:hypothetical protein
MNKLEQRIYRHIIGMNDDLDPIEAGAIAAVAAKVCLEIAERAYEKGWIVAGYQGVVDLPERFKSGLEDFKKEVL